MLLDRIIPTWDFRERHRAAVRAAPDAVLRAVHEVTWREVPVFRALVLDRFGSGRIDPGSPVLAGFVETGPFRVLARDDREIVLGLLSKVPGRAAAPPADPGGEEFRDYAEPRCIKIAFNFRVADGHLSTETRVRATDPAGRRLFRLYWTVIRLPSGLIRRVWLGAIVRRLAAGSHG